MKTKIDLEDYISGKGVNTYSFVHDLVEMMAETNLDLQLSIASGDLDLATEQFDMYLDMIRDEFQYYLDCKVGWSHFDGI